MSLYGSLFSSVSSLNAQGNCIAMAADNISNISTVGYKEAQASFATLITSSNSATSYSSGGVQVYNRPRIDSQGLIQASNVVTDISISGTGFFTVNTATDSSGEYLYTRAGSFRKDALGNLVNAAGYTLLGWPLDNLNRLPGAPGNLNTTSSALLTSLQPVNINAITGSASATTQVTLGMNLKESEVILPGSGETIAFPSSAPNNTGISASDVISPENSGPNIFNVGDSITLTPSTPGNPTTYTYGGLTQSVDITTAGVLGVSTSTQTFTTPTNGWVLQINNQTSGVVNLTFQANSPSTANGQFNSLETLAQALDQVNGITARVTPNGKYLLVAPKDATQNLTFTNIAPANFKTVLGLNNIVGAANQFSNLQGLANLMNATSGIKAVVDNPLASATLQFYATNPLGTLTVASTAAGLPSTSVSILDTLGLTNISPSTFGPGYDPTGVNAFNIAGGHITPQFSRNIQIFDAFGTGHNFDISFAKVDINTWGVEIYAATPKDIISSRTDGQVAYGTIVFNGDGSLRTVSASLTNPINILWANQALPSDITFNWGTAGQVAGTVGATSIGETNGLRQLDAPYNVDFANQNGVASGLLSGISIDTNGFVTANFTNGTARNVFQLPLADFANIDGLQAAGGNAYSETTNSGNYNLKIPGMGGAGVISPSSLEQSDVELSDELTNMIIAQRGYQASSQVIKIVNDMLDDLNRAVS